MTYEEAVNVIGCNRPTWELRAMVKALRLHSWLNTADDARRLTAAKVLLRYRNRRQGRRG